MDLAWGASCGFPGRVWHCHRPARLEQSLMMTVLAAAGAATSARSSGTSGEPDDAQMRVGLTSTAYHLSVHAHKCCIWCTLTRRGAAHQWAQ